MLAQFTWQEFWLTTLLLTVLWYSVIFLLYYRKQLHLFLSKVSANANQTDTPAHRWVDRVEDYSEMHEENNGLLGVSKPVAGTSTVSLGQVSFVNDENSKSEQIGLIPDILQEMKEIFSILEKEDGDKKDFFNLMEMVRAKYGQIGSNPRIVQINQFIAEHAPFHLSPDELENLWD